MKNLIILLLIPMPSFAACLADTSFKNFVNKNNFFKSDNPHLLLDQYVKQNELSYKCSYEKVKSLIPNLVMKWKKEGESNGCFDTPLDKSCSDEMRFQVFGNITMLERWYEWVKINEIPPKSSFWPTSLERAPETESVSSVIGESLNVTNKIRKIESEIKNVKCNESAVALADSSPNYEYFKDILKKGEDVTLDELLVLWFPNEEEFHEDPYFFDCQSEPWQPLNKARKIESLYYLEQSCKPDVLYSWGSKTKLEGIKSNLPNNVEWRKSPIKRDEASEERNLFMAMTPAITYGYGPIIIRFKIKKETPFPLGASNVTSSSVDKKELTGVRVRQDMPQDFTINKSSFLESYSFGTAEIYDEIVRDILRYKNKMRAQHYFGVFFNWSTYKVEPRNAEEGLNNLLKFTADGFSFSEKILKRRLIDHIKMVLEGQGRVIFQKGICKNRKMHYQTGKPTYFNPN